MPLIQDWTDILLRLGFGTLVGMAPGFDREIRGFDAGLRTHGLVALSSAMLTVSSLMLFAAGQFALLAIASGMAIVLLSLVGILERFLPTGSRRTAAGRTPAAGPTSAGGTRPPEDGGSPPT